MAASELFFRLAVPKVSPKSRTMEICAAHNLREFPCGTFPANIDPARTDGNIILRGADSVQGVVDEEAKHLSCLEKPPRKNAAHALELVFSLRPDSTVSYQAYFEACTIWAEEYYCVPILSSVVHVDESAPHCHVLLLPIFDGRLQRLTRGGRAAMQRANANFFEQVAVKFGLSRSVKPRMRQAEREHLTSEIVKALRDNPSELQRPEVADCFRDLIRNDPLPLANVLGIKTAIADSSVTESVSKLPVLPDKMPQETGRKSKPLSCVALSNSAIVPDVIEQPKSAQDVYRRVRDDEHMAGLWNPETGEFVQHLARQRQTVLLSE